MKPDVLFSTVAKRAGKQVADLVELDFNDGYIDESIVPHIIGVNTQDVLQRLMGDAQLYEMLFKQFLNDYHDANASLLRLLQEDHPSAERLAHSMKGVAGTLGMATLADAATQLEAALNAHPGDAGKTLQPFSDALAEMLAAVKAVYGQTTASSGEI